MAFTWLERVRTMFSEDSASESFMTEMEISWLVTHWVKSQGAVTQGVIYPPPGGSTRDCVVYRYGIS